MPKIFVWVPATLYLGTRPIGLIAMALVFVSCIWCGATHSFKGLMAARILCGFATSCAEVLPAIVVKDLFFLHERGWWMGLYIVFFQCLPLICTVMSGFIITGAGWRWHFWVSHYFIYIPLLMFKVSSIVCGIGFLLLFFFFPETQYYRPPSSQLPQPSTSPDEVFVAGIEKVTDLPPPATPPKKSYLQQLKPWSGINPGIEKNTSLLFLIVRGWPLVIYPAVAYAIIAFAVAVGCCLLCFNTSPSIFQSSPYNFSPGVQSLIFLAGMIGGVTGSVAAGGLTDVYAKFRSQRNKGIFEPEDRLVMLLIPLIISPCGVLMDDSSSTSLIGRYGLGVEHLESWALPYIGIACMYIAVGAVPTITIAYGNLNTAICF